jgi:hypothetical protein
MTSGRVCPLVVLLPGKQIANDDGALDSGAACNAVPDYPETPYLFSTCSLPSCNRLQASIRSDAYTYWWVRRCQQQEMFIGCKNIQP